MIALNVVNISLSLAGRTILSGLSLQVHADRLVGPVGPNGAGKLSLLKLMAGEYTLDAGTLNRARGLSVGTLAQEPILDPDKTALEEALSAMPELAQVEAELERLEARLSDPAVCADEKRLARTLDQQARLHDRFDALGGPTFERRVRDTLQGLGFDQASLHTRVPALSGGQRKLVGLTRLLIAHPQLLLLDEPDNNLDIASAEVLRAALDDFEGTVLAISHDRYFLDRMAGRVVELKDGVITEHLGGYSEYLADLD